MYLTIKAKILGLAISQQYVAIEPIAHAKAANDAF